jgi:hypothetical protein
MHPASRHVPAHLKPNPSSNDSRNCILSHLRTPTAARLQTLSRADRAATCGIPHTVYEGGIPLEFLFQLFKESVQSLLMRLIHCENPRPTPRLRFQHTAARATWMGVMSPGTSSRSDTCI